MIIIINFIELIGGDALFSLRRGSFFFWFFFSGEFAAFITVSNLVMDYVLSNAAVSRGLTAYFGTVIGLSTAKWRFTVHGLPEGFNEIDLVAVAVVLLVTLIISYR